MYKELLDEAGKNKKYDMAIEEHQTTKDEFKGALAQKNEFLAYTKR